MKVFEFSIRLPIVSATMLVFVILLSTIVRNVTNGKMFFYAPLAIAMAALQISESLNEGTFDKYGVTVRTTLGYVRGKTVSLANGKNVDAYLGIPYGKPPLGELRFRYPQPASSWDGVLDATSFSNSCMQNPNRVMKMLPGGHRMLPSTAFSEDCLYLNVWVPTARRNKTTVMVFVHGGGFSLGSTSTPGYSGQILASEEDVIVVSFNYRLASLGFMYLDHEDLDANVGLFDQVLALNWVRDNIEQFGGDRDSVTLFGQSAGACSIGFHLISSMSQGLFRRAVLQSGSPVAYWSVKSKEFIKDLSLRVANFIGCDQDKSDMANIIKCLRKMDASELINNEPIQGFDVFAFWPVVDGTFLKEYPIDSLRRGDFKKTDLMVGVTRNEGTGFMTLAVPLTYLPSVNKVKGDHEDLVETIRYFFPNSSKLVRKAIEFEYTNWRDPENSKEVLSSGEKMVGDYFYSCGMNTMGKFYVNAKQNVYKYYFTYRSPAVEWMEWFGTPHTEELRYVFGDVFEKGSNYTEEDRAFSRRLMRYWVNFARKGDPNEPPPHDGAEDTVENDQWPKLSSLNGEYLILSPKSKAVGLKFREKKCAFWDQLVPYLNGHQPLGNSIL